MRLPVQTECRTRESPQALCARLRSDSNASQSTAELRDSSDRCVNPTFPASTHPRAMTCASSNRTPHTCMLQAF
eukprot:5584757-Pleurochrysis_carterae.AAC.4